MAAIRWVTCDPVTGAIIESLPGLQVTSSLSSILGRGDTATFALPIDTETLPRRWKIATEPDRVVLIGHYDDAAQTPLWGGIITRRTYSNGPTITLAAEQPEAWLAGLYVPDGDFTATDLSILARFAGLDYAVAWLHGTVDYTPCGVTRDQTYRDADDKPRLTALQELMRLPGGPEFTFRWTWDGGGNAVCTGIVAPRIGRAFPNGNPTFVLGRGEWEIGQDYTTGQGATIVTGVAVRQGDQRTAVTRQSALLNSGWIPREYRYQPETTTTDPNAIATAVAQRLADIQRGSKTITIKSNLEDFLVGRDFNAGDDIGLDFRNPDLPELNLPLQARAVGWVAEPDRTSGQLRTITPVFLGDDD